ncbi:MAG: ABC-2 transporter permease [Sarcina sp.]
MKGLFIKEIFNSKLFIVLGIIVYIASIGNLATGNIEKNISSICIVAYIFAMLILVSINLDKSTKWDQFAIVMPIKKSTIVMSRYLIIGIMMLIGLIIITPISIIIGDNFSNVIFSIMLNSSLVILIMDIMIPLTIKFSPNIAVIIIFVILAFQMLFMFDVGKINNLLKFNSFLLMLIVFCASLIVTIISYKISLQVYKKKIF